MNYQQFIQQASREAVVRGKEESAVYLLLQYVSHLNASELYMKMNQMIEETIVQQFNTLFHRYLDENVPVQYLIGTSCFYGYDFKVNPSVLIPRRETEELVEQILYRYDRYFKGEKVEVCDIATGSGCIGITLSLEEKNMKVIATDISEEALEVARENNQLLGADVTFLQGDMLEPLVGRKFDILVSNPPYIPEEEEVMSLVKDNEPNIALFGGQDGMKFYRIILSGAKALLKDKALLCFEHGYDKREEMMALATQYFPSCKVEVLKDLEGKDRMTFIYVGDFE